MEQIGDTVRAELARLRSMRKVTIQIAGLADGTKTPFDGKYVSRYEPEKWVLEDVGSLEEMCDKIERWLGVVDDPEDAIHFDNVGDAAVFWRRPVDSVRPWDGKQNRPLTAFNVSFERVSDPSPHTA